MRDYCTGPLQAKTRDSIPVTNWQRNVDNNDGYGNLHIIVSGLVFERNGDLGTEFPAAKRINYGPSVQRVDGS